MITLGRLYKIAKTGAIVICDISIEGNKFTVTTGKLDGALIDHVTLCYPKNEGKANETTAEEQAQKEAKAKYVKKIKSGYVTDPEGKTEVKLPMGVKKYQDQKKNVKFPCIGSPKLNGVNGEYRRTPNGLKLYSRGGNEYPVIKHHKNEILIMMNLLKTDTLNGEIYNHGMHLQDIVSATKVQKEETSCLDFYIFEIPDSQKWFKEKVALFDDIKNNIKDFRSVKIIENTILSDHISIERYFDKTLSAGFEGIVIRNPNCKYVYNTRSSDAFKYKKALDAEYKIISYTLDKYKHPVFTCDIAGNSNADDANADETFKVKMKGTSSERLIQAANADTFIGKYMQIEYEMLSKTDIPLKPVGIRIRECDIDGNPTE